MTEAIVQSSCTKLRSAIGDEAIMRLNFTAHLQEILEQLVATDAVIPNAKDWWLFKNTYHETGEVWLFRVKDIADRVCHVVDELQVMTVPPAGNNKMLIRPKNINVIDEAKNKTLLDKMKKMKEDLKELHKDSVLFDLLVDQKAFLREQAEETTVEREDAVDKILAQLSDCQSSKGPIILPIHGEHGVGKETVAAKIFNDNRFKGYSRIWIHHSRKLHFHEIGNYIISQLESAGEEEMRGHGSNDDLKHIKVRLHELLNGKKVLLVLHNIDNHQSHWKELKDMLSVRGMGSTQVIVIATLEDTWSDDINTVAMRIFGVQPYHLEPMSDEMCCQIIKQVAVHSRYTSADKEDLERIAPEVAKLCKGIPMAAQLFGSVLQFKQYTEWAELLELKVFPQNPMVLSYRSMPLSLRLCFDYSVFIFRTERHIVKEDLLHQWIALDLIEPSEVFSTTQLAEQYLRKLLDMSLLQTTKSSQTSVEDDTRAILITMHRMVFEFAQSSIGNDFGYKEEGSSPGRNEGCVYALVGSLNGTLLESIFPDPKLRALRCLRCSKMELHVNSFSFAWCLRVLEVHGSSIQKLPESICQMRHLGYLKLSGWSGLKNLPESIGDLTNLLHIDLSSCSELENIPGSFGKLINLLYVSISGSSKLERLPESFGKLIKLVHIDLSGSSGLVQLPESFGKLINLVHINLSGCLALVNLPGSFVKLTNLVHINLSGCPGLVDLPVSFGKLTNLTHINLSGCSGLVNLPVSFGKLTNLAHLNLSGCSELATLPSSFGDLQNLLHVNLSRCYGLSKLPESFGKLKKIGSSGFIILVLF